jgi:hypothetical protein
MEVTRIRVQSRADPLVRGRPPGRPFFDESESSHQRGAAASRGYVQIVQRGVSLDSFLHFYGARPLGQSGAIRHTVNSPHI